MDLQIKNGSIFAGTDSGFTECLQDYPASQYDLIVYIKQGTNTAVQLTVEVNSEDADSFDITYTQDQLKPGANQFQYIFTNKTTNKIIVEEGFINIKALLNSSVDSRSEEQKILDALKEARLKIVGRDYTEVNINGKSTKFKTLTEIENAIAVYERKLGIRVTPKIINSFG